MAYDEELAEGVRSLVDHDHVRRFEMRGREMDGWLHVDVEAVEDDADLSRWVGHGLTYARSLTPPILTP